MLMLANARLGSDACIFFNVVGLTRLGFKLKALNPPSYKNGRPTHSVIPFDRLLPRPLPVQSNLSKSIDHGPILIAPFREVVNLGS